MKALSRVDTVTDSVDACVCIHACLHAYVWHSGTQGLNTEPLPQPFFFFKFGDRIY